MISSSIGIVLDEEARVVLLCLRTTLVQLTAEEAERLLHSAEAVDAAARVRGWVEEQRLEAHDPHDPGAALLRAQQRAVDQQAARQTARQTARQAGSSTGRPEDEERDNGRDATR